MFRFIIGDAGRHLTGNMEINRKGMLPDWSDLSSVPLIVGGLSNEDNNREVHSSRIGYERFSGFVPEYAFGPWIAFNCLSPNPGHWAVRSRTGAVFRRLGLSIAPSFLWECLSEITPGKAGGLIM